MGVGNGHDRPGAWSSPTLADLVVRLRDAGIGTAHVGIFDLFGTFRERRLALDDLAQVFGEGGSFVNVLPHWDAGEHVFGAGPFVGEPVAIDPNSARPYPFEPSAALIIADYAGPSAAFSPRLLLKAQIEKARRLGFGVRAALEFEFFLLEESAESLRESGYARLDAFAKDNRCWAGESAASHAGFVRELHDNLAAGGIDLLSLGLELGPGCFEATLKATDALRAADDAAAFKMFTKAFCRARGLTAAFMAQLAAERAGLSGHIHLSLYDLATGRPLFPEEGQKADKGGAHGMSALFRHFVAGMVQLAPEALAMTHHNVNSYRRLAPGNWAPKTASWAVQNYSVGVRVVTSPAQACRLEYRLLGSDVNPYLGLAFALGAGLWGIENKMPLPAPFLGGGPNEMPKGEVPLPHDLFEAAERIERSLVAREVFGAGFIDHFAKLCRVEEAALRRATGAPERARYLEVV
jgi:glutamine synthetase